MAAAVGYTLFPTNIGTCGIAWRADELVAAHLPEATEAETARRLRDRAGAAELADPPVIMSRNIARIQALFEGTRDDLADIACDLRALDPFRRRVYEATRAIGPGATTTYGAIAVALGDKAYAQAVGRALGSNPLPIVVPCHRVLGANGRLTGFSAGGGIATKLKMLSIEGVVFGEPGLFGELPLQAKIR
jgi:methylated-DNA-[protein]-cysteine S-methyltransferase